MRGPENEAKQKWFSEHVGGMATRKEPRETLHRKKTQTCTRSIVLDTRDDYKPNNSILTFIIPAHNEEAGM